MIKSIKKTILILVLIWNTACLAQTYPPNDPHWTQTWDDNFIGGTSYTSKYYAIDNFDHGGEPEVYLSANVTQNSINGVQMQELGVTTPVNCTGCTWSPHYYTSGAFTSGNSARIIQYGYVEATIQVPNNYGLFPAFWLWNCITDPVSGNVTYNEIDIFEDVPGTMQDNPAQPLYGIIRDQHSMTSNIHFNQSLQTTCEADYNDGQINPIPTSIGDYTGWHKYGVEWTPSKIIWYIDGKVYRNTVNPGFSDSSPTTPGSINEAMNIIFDLAIASYVRYNGIPSMSSPPTCTSSNPTNACFYDVLTPTPLSPPNTTSLGSSTGNTLYYDVPTWYTSINSTSINSTTSSIYMNVKDIQYWQMPPSSSCNGNTFTISNSFNWSNPPSSGYSYSSINANIITSGAVSMPTNATNYIRATNSITIGGGGSSFTMGSGATLYLDVNPCHN